jgi:ABC-type transporter Mla MlaB component
LSAFATNSGINAYTVAVTDEPDFTFRRELCTSIIGALEHGKRRIVVDCSGWHHLDFGLLSVLIRCARAASVQGADFELVNLAGNLRSNIQALRLDDRLGLRA